MGVLEFLVPLYQINTAWVVFSSDLKMDPLNLYPTMEKLDVSTHGQPYLLGNIKKLLIMFSFSMLPGDLYNQVSVCKVVIKLCAIKVLGF